MNDNQISYSAIYLQLIKQWITHLQVSQFYETFITKLQKKTGLPIIRDLKIVQIVQCLLKSQQYQIFSQQSSKVSERKQLFTIIDVLLERRFINLVSYNRLKRLKNVYIKHNLLTFLQIAKEMEGKAQLQQLFENLVDMKMTNFWKYIQKNEIKDDILSQIYKKSKICQALRSNDQVFKHIYAIQPPDKRHIIQQNKEQLQKIITMKNVVQVKKEKIEPRRHQRQKYQINNKSQINRIQRHQSQRQQRIYEQFWFNKDKYQTYHSYMRKIQPSQSNLNAILSEIAFKRSLFYNREHVSILRSIHKFIIQISGMIDHDQIQSQQLFGSLRSTLALSNEFDIDLTTILNRPKRGNYRQDNREESKTVLFKIKRLLSQYGPKWIKSMYVNIHEKLPLPFLKIDIEKDQFYKQFGLQNFEKTDITIGNRTAIKNSQMISYFAKNERITLFCILVKLWAKANNIINSKAPMKGLSGYGVILMCLYYLMDSNQIDFISFEGQFDINSSEITPNLDKCDLLSIQQNFLGFLNFYKETGDFQKKCKTVCLLKYCSRLQQNFNEEIIINMYDFIDKSNPGRLKIENKNDFFEKFQKSIKMMKLGNQRIFTLFNISQ